jgi:hypothetical protein
VGIVTRVKELLARLFGRQQRTADLRQRVAEDAELARLHLVAVIVDARRVDAPVAEEVMASLVVLAGWTHWLMGWAAESEL